MKSQNLDDNRNKNPFEKYVLDPNIEERTAFLAYVGCIVLTPGVIYEYFQRRQKQKRELKLKREKQLRGQQNQIQNNINQTNPQHHQPPYHGHSHNHGIATLLANSARFLNSVAPIILTTLITLPITLPTAILSSPIFLITRSTVHTKKIISDFYQKMQKCKQLENAIQQAQNQKLQKQSNAQAEKLLQIEAQIFQQTSKRLFLQNNKRLIILSPSLKNKNQKIQPTTDHSINPVQKADKNDPSADQLEFIFIIDKDKHIYDIITLLKRKINNKKDSFHLFMAKKLVNINSKIEDLKSNQDEKQNGIIRLNYTKIQTFG